VNTGPGTNSNRRPPPSVSRSTLTPVTSLGIRSGVNCTRPNAAPIAPASARTRSVFAVPGTPSSSAWPRASTVTSASSTTRSCPTTAVATAARTRPRRSARRSASAGAAGASASGAGIGAAVGSDMRGGRGSGARAAER
jgi:hypothetical protein